MLCSYKKMSAKNFNSYVVCTYIYVLCMNKNICETTSFYIYINESSVY